MSLEQRRGLAIAMDGPAGAGKSTIAKIIANHLGYLYVDTGAMYRALALKALRQGVNIEDDDALTQMAATTDVRLERLPSGGNRVLLDGEDVTAEIRSPQVDRVVSRVSAAQGLRQHLIAMQREMAKNGGVVMDGRDIGSYVLPNADLKFYIDASLAERARRRQQQQAQVGIHQDLAEIEAEIARRDESDRNKGPSSLVRTPDAIYVDTTGRGVDEVVQEILAHCRRD